MDPTADVEILAEGSPKGMRELCALLEAHGLQAALVRPPGGSPNA